MGALFLSHVAHNARVAWHQTPLLRYIPLATTEHSCALHPRCCDGFSGRVTGLERAFMHGTRVGGQCLGEYRRRSSGCSHVPVQTSTARTDGADVDGGEAFLHDGGRGRRQLCPVITLHTARTARGAACVNETARRSINRAAAQTWAFTNCGLVMADVTSLPSCCHSAKLWSLVLVGNWMVDASSSRQYVLLVKDMFIKPDGIVAMSIVPLG